MRSIDHGRAQRRWGDQDRAHEAKDEHVYDVTLMGDFSLPAERVASVAVPTLVIDGETTPWMSHAAQATASALPNAHRRTLEGQPHNVDPEALAPTLVEFFADQHGA